MLNSNFVDGAPVWVDLGAPDVARAAEFYGSVFGWKFESAGPDAGGYGMFTRDGKVVAAAGPLTEQGAAPSWTLYFRTSDADATAGAVRKAGGTVRGTVRRDRQRPSLSTPAELTGHAGRQPSHR